MLRAVTVTLPPLPATLGPDAPRRRAARAALLRTLFDARGDRRLPRHADLRAALRACTAEDAWWACEANSASPLYLLPTSGWVRALASRLDDLRVRSVLEIAAGDGFLSRCLRRARPSLRVRATDDASWRRVAARMSASERRARPGVAGLAPGADVERMAASTAVARHRPDLVIVSWAPPGLMVERAIRGPCRFVLDLSPDGDACGNGLATWRFRKEMLDGPVESLMLCRLDGGATSTAMRATLYFGARHPGHGIDETFRIPAAPRRAPRAPSRAARKTARASG